MVRSQLVDVYDELGRHRGARDRVTAHAEGWWHVAFHLLIVAHRDAGPAAILQRRAMAKATFPGLLDLSVTGHLEAGESPLDGLREAREELGVELDPAALVSLGVRRIVDETPEGLNRELCHAFIARDDRPLDAYCPDPAEVSAVVELSVDAGRDLFSGAVDRVEAVEVPVGGEARPIEVTSGHFVPEGTLGDLAPDPGHGYWLTLLAMAELFSEGDTRLSI